MARLNTYIHVQDEQGTMHVFGPDDDVPDWAAKTIMNPNVWDEADDKLAKPETQRKAPARRKSSEG
jgi:hypothetical protein